MAFNVLFFFSFLCPSFSLCITNSLHCTSVGYKPQLATKTTLQVIVTFVGYGIFHHTARDYYFFCTFFPVSTRRKPLFLLFTGTDRRLNDMSEAQNPNQQRVGQVEAQAAQLTTGQRVVSNTQQSQGRSASHADRSGRGERQRIQRSSSSTSSSSAVSNNEQRSGGRAEAQLGGSSYQQYSSEGAYSYGGAAGATLGASDGSFGSIGSGERRQGRHRRQVIRLPDQQQGQVRQVRRRLPTPEPDTLERV